MKQDWLFAAIGLLVAVGAGETACKSAIIFGVLATIAILSDTAGLPALADVTTMMQGVRHDSSLVRRLIGGEPDGTSNQMIFENEVIKAGVIFDGRFVLRPHAMPADKAFLGLILQTWMEAGAHVGGRSQVGHGRLDIDIDDHLNTGLQEFTDRWSSDEGRELHAKIRAVSV